jgi:molybdenum-dependent DNA-binding transcriptional regulator ModE
VGQVYHGLCVHDVVNLYNRFILLFHIITMKLSQWAKKLGISYKTAWRTNKDDSV